MSSSAENAIALLPDARGEVASGVEKQLHGDALAQTRTMRLVQQAGIAVGRAVFIAVVLIVWGVASGRWLDAQAVSDPVSVATAILDLVETGRLWPQLWQTVSEVFAGYLAGAVAGSALAFAFVLVPDAERVLRPFLLALYSVPKIALAPLVIMWFGLGVAPKIILAGMFVFFIVFMNAVAGIQNVNAHHVNIVRVMGASRLAVVRKVVFPTMMPFLILGLRISIPEAMTGAVIGEFISASKGLGYLVYSASNELNTAVSLAALIVLVLVVAIADFALGLLERLSPWQPVQNGAGRPGLRPR
jgi:NitT/TauT family transport system permease protein